MHTDPSFFSFILNAGLVVKLVLMLLIMASVFSWTIIFQRSQLFKKTRNAIADFESRFWSGTSADELFAQIKANKAPAKNTEAIFMAGYQEFQRLNEKSSITPQAVMEGTTRAMRIAQARELEKLENQLAFLATVGSTSPYVGLFGTVWGIMTSFQSLGGVQQATIAMVAPGISEALIATAIGLFTAIPAVIAYNRFSNQLTKMQECFDTFEDEFTNILHREIYA